MWIHSDFSILARHQREAVICREIAKGLKTPWKREIFLLEAQISTDTDEAEDYGVNNSNLMETTQRLLKRLDLIESQSRQVFCSTGWGC